MKKKKLNELYRFYFPSHEQEIYLIVKYFRID